MSAEQFVHELGAAVLKHKITSRDMLVFFLILDEALSLRAPEVEFRSEYILLRRLGWRGRKYAALRESLKVWGQVGFEKAGRVWTVRRSGRKVIVAFDRSFWAAHRRGLCFVRTPLEIVRELRLPRNIMLDLLLRLVPEIVERKDLAGRLGIKDTNSTRRRGKINEAAWAVARARRKTHAVRIVPVYIGNFRIQIRSRSGPRWPRDSRRYGWTTLYDWYPQRSGRPGVP